MRHGPTRHHPDPNPLATRVAARVALLGALALLGTLAGCQHDAHRDGDLRPLRRNLPRRPRPAPVDPFVQVQSAAAARADATLTADHFDARGGLNSLGRQKLDLMLRDDDASTPLLVYLDLPATAASASAATPGAATSAPRTRPASPSTPTANPSASTWPTAA